MSFWRRLNLVIFAILAVQFGYRALVPRQTPDTPTSMAWLAWQRDPNPETERTWKLADSEWRQRQRVRRMQHAAVSLVASGIVVGMLIRRFRGAATSEVRDDRPRSEP